MSTEENTYNPQPTTTFEADPDELKIEAEVEIAEGEIAEGENGDGSGEDTKEVKYKIPKDVPYKLENLTPTLREALIGVLSFPPPEAYLLENIPAHLRACLNDALSVKAEPVGNAAAAAAPEVDATAGEGKPKRNRRSRDRPKKPAEPEPEEPIEGGYPIPFAYSSKDWLGKTPKSYVVEYFQRSNLQLPKWNRESHANRQKHLIKVTFQDQIGREITIFADHYFRSMKEAEHNTAILVLSHFFPGAREPKDIVERMAQLAQISKIQKKRKGDQRSMRMSAYTNKKRTYGRAAPPPNLYPPNPASAYDKNSQNSKQYENYGYGYGQYYDPATLAPGGYAPQAAYDYYQQAYGANYDYYNQHKDTQPDYSNPHQQAQYNPYAASVPQRPDNRPYPQPPTPSSVNPPPPPMSRPGYPVAGSTPAASGGWPTYNPNPTPTPSTPTPPASRGAYGLPPAYGTQGASSARGYNGYA